MSLNRENNVITSDIAQEEIDVNVVDADGAVYNGYYRQLLLFIIDEYWDFLAEYGPKKELVGKDMPFALAKAQTIFASIDAYQSKPFDGHYTIKNPKLSALVENFKIRLQIERQEKGQAQPTDDEVCGAMIQYGMNLMNHLTREFVERIFLKANESLIQFFLERAEKHHIKKCSIGSASSRQSQKLDSWGMEQNATGSIFSDVELLKNHLQNHLKPDEKCIVSEFCGADIYGNLPRGKSFANVKANVKKELHGVENLIPISHADYLYDHTKLTLLYAICHDAVINVTKELNVDPKKTIINVNFFDDRWDILGKLAEVFSENRKLLPKNLRLNFFRYVGGTFNRAPCTVIGSGEIDHYFDENVKYMAKLCKFKNLATPIDAANTINVKQFLNFRKKDSKVSDVTFISLPKEMTLATRQQPLEFYLSFSK